MNINKKRIIIASLIGFILIAGYIVNLLRTSSQGTRASLKATKTFTPSIIPFSAPEIINSNRGLYRWRTGEVVPIGDGSTHTNTSIDTYDRFTWKDIEPTDGSWNFTAMKQKAAEARAKGGKFSFGIYAVCTNSCDKVSVPTDIEANRGTYGGTIAPGGEYVPDWNNANFLNRMDRMLMRVGEEMKRDLEFGNSIGYIEIRIYGNWGEWHMAGLNGFPRITEASQIRIVDGHAKAFGNKQLVMMANGHYAIAYAMDLNASSNPSVRKPIGWRNDCLGLNENGFKDSNDNEYRRVVEHFRGMVKEPIPADPGPENPAPPALEGNPPDYSYKNYWRAVAWSKMKDRWQTAPVVTEFCPLYPDRKLEANLSGTPVPVQDQISEVQAAINQVTDFHVALVGNGNIASNFWYNPGQSIGGTNADKWNAFTQAEKDKLFILGKTAGYRFELSTFTLPAQLTQGNTFIVNAMWRNAGVAPQYEPWDTYVELRDPANGNLVWRSTPSEVDFEKLLPSATANRREDVFTLPASVPVGTYDVHVMVEDQFKKMDGTPYRAPMALAIEGRQADGSYKLGSVEVVSATISPSQTVTPEPSVTIDPSVTVEPTLTGTVTPSVTSNPTSTPELTVTPTDTLTPTGISGTISPSLSPTPDTACPLHPKGDANCDQLINADDYALWRAVYISGVNPRVRTNNPDFNSDGKQDLKDFEIWRRNRGN